MKLKIKSVSIPFTEYKNLKTPFTGTIEQVNLELQTYSRNCKLPSDGSQGYHKTDFKIDYGFGEFYEGRIDIKEGMTGKIIQDHIRGLADFYMGVAKPSHMSTEQYEKFLSDPHSASIGKTYKELMDGYELD